MAYNKSSQVAGGDVMSETKVDQAGNFRASIARITNADGTRVVDKEGDAYLGPQAFPVGKAVVISAYQHTSWSGALPVGYGVVGANQHSAWVSGQFFTDTTAGRDTYLTVKALASRGLGEWSYGYDVLDQATDRAEIADLAPGAKRLLKSLNIFEASPVLVGAGVGTQTDEIKAAEEYERFMKTVRALRVAGVLPPEREDALAKQIARILEGATATLRRTRS
jgi:hypothetical protein